MRVPPVRRSRERRARIRPWMVVVVGLLVALFLSARGLASFYTDYLWFDSIGRGDTWRALLWARFAPAGVFTVVFFVLMFTSLTIADRLSPRTRGLGPEDEMLVRYQQTVAPYAGRIRILVSLLFAVLAGASVVGQWQRWVLFTHAQDFGVKDPQFHKDVGFYVFRLPFLSFVFDWLFAGLIIVLIVTAIAHYLNGGIRLQAPFQRVTPQVKAHLSVILALMALVKTAQYYLARYDLDFSTRGFVQGATKTDVAAQLPAYNLLMVISIAAAGLLVWNIWRRGWVLPVIAVGLWGFVALVIGTIVPAVYQQFFVKPNELAKEKPYIARNIEATRAAFDLAGVKVNQFDYATDLTTQDLVDDSQTIDNARLWEPAVVARAFQIFQSLQTYYRFLDADADRYMIDNQLRQVLIAARELNRDDLPSQSWVNRHVVYTHGYGAVVSPANTADADGQPNYLLSDIPDKGDIELDRPQLYFGEGLDGYALVDAKQREFDYPKSGKGGGNATTRYKGTAGVTLSSLLRRTAFALRFGDQNLVISSQIEDKTRILYRRDVRERVETAAPFLHFDSDPYPVITDGRLVWVFDGFTTSDHYPYSQSLTPSEGGLDGKRFNYIRNSVKATVDAYDGTITYYVVDPSDPMIKAYRAAFPDLFTDFSKMPDGVRAHLRYPQDLFRYQTDVYRKYHVTQPTEFFSGTGFWEVSADPALVNEDGTSLPTRVPQDASSSGPRIEPLYVLTRLPGRTREEFLIIRPFVPVSKGNTQNRLASFMVARANPQAKVPLEALEMPTGNPVPGPVQVDGTINNTAEISRQISLLDQKGSAVSRGTIQIIPVKNSLLYIQPIYVVSDKGTQPALRAVVVFYDGEAKIGDTLDAALVQFSAFRDLPTDQSTPSTTVPGGTGGEPPTGRAVDDLLAEASRLYQEGQDALANQDLGTYQQRMADVGNLLEQIAEARSTEQAGGASTPSSTTTTTRPAGGGTQALGRPRG